jgi:CRP-like cAMP-binding protein
MVVPLEGAEAAPWAFARLRSALRRGKPPAALRDIELFSGCSERELRDITRLGHLKSFSQGAQLTREGDPGDALFVILQGTIGIQRNGEVIATRGPSEFIGEIALLSHSPRTATVHAATTVKAFVIPGRPFRALLGRQPELQRKVFEALAARVPED